MRKNPGAAQQALHSGYAYSHPFAPVVPQHLMVWFSQDKQGIDAYRRDGFVPPINGIYREPASD
jgi:hypothetical protein